MPLFLRWLREFRKHLALLSWAALALILIVHCTVSWGLLSIAGETRIIEPIIWVYYYITTATTIGYGDFSPQTDPGRIITALWIMPGAVGLFALFLGKATTSFIDTWKRRAMGKHHYTEMKGHTILVGWHQRDTPRMVDLLLGDTTTDDEGIVLVCADLQENPLPDSIRFVRAESLADPAVYRRAGITAASRVIIHTPSDEKTLAAAFALLANRPSAHIVAHFYQTESAEVLRAHHPSVECTHPLHVEVLVRASQDAGSAFVATELLSVLSGPTQFSLHVPAAAPVQTFGDLFTGLKSRHRATLLGYAPNGTGQLPVLNPPDTTMIHPGMTLYYIAEQRIPETALMEGVK